MRRYFNITPTNTTNVVATVRLYWRDAVDETNANQESDVRIYHCDPATSTWTRLGVLADYTRSGELGGYDWVQLANVTTFSPFVIGGGPGQATAVTLSDFDARAPSDSPTLIMLGIGLVMLCGGGWLIRKRLQ